MSAKAVREYVPIASEYSSMDVCTKKGTGGSGHHFSDDDV
jgi:hypothetical protein